MNRIIDVVKLALLVVLASSGVLADSSVESIEGPDATKLWDVSNGSIETVADPQGKVLRWHINAGQTSVLSLKKDHPLLSRLRYYNTLRFEYRIAGGEINGFDLNMLGHVSGPRAYKVHNWNLGVLTTSKNEWHFRYIDLARPNWFPWDNPDGDAESVFLRLESLALVPGTILELRNIRLLSLPLLLKPDYELPITWPEKTQGDDGSVTYTINYQVTNASGRPATVAAKVLSHHTRFKVQVSPETQDVKNGANAQFKLTALISKEDIAAAPELYAEPLQLEFATSNDPQAPCNWQGQLVRPLSAAMKRQVVASQADVEFLRARITANDTAAREVTGIDSIVQRADQLLAVRFDTIPGGHQTVANSLPWVPGTNRPWQPGSYLGEIVDKETGKREAGTNDANQFWKEYLGYGGATENLGKAYLLTGDEKYAAKAVELFELYGKQYSDLTWFNRFDPPGNSGPATLSSSRTSYTSTYGSNWFFKWHCKLLSMIAESQAWQKADKQLIYKGFVLPYATELIKFPGGISNMTDITDGNLLLLGIVFDDAGLVRQALLSDPGLLKRLDDLTADGFSSEGRPINYHYAAMEECLPALGYLANSGLKVTYGKEKLLAALRMPFLRATLWGAVPLSGDMGRGGQIRNTQLADYLVSLFPDEAWLLEIGQGSSFAAKAATLRTAKKPDADAWRKMVQAQPQLFADAGLALLRTGSTPDDQIMVSLDYGRSVFHSALDRNQLTLAAFGKMFTQGTGSLYNAGTGGVTLNPDKKLQAFVSHGSLGQNVVTVDGQDQLPAVGELLAWNSKANYQYAVSRVAGIAPGVSHTRGVVLSEGVVILLDRVESTQPHIYDWIYHNFGEFKLPANWQQSPVPSLGNTANYDNLVEPLRITGEGPLQAEWDMTGQVVDVAAADKPAPSIKLVMRQLPVSGGEFYRTSTGMNNPNTAILADKTATIIHRVKGTKVEFATLLEPCRGQSRVRSFAAGKDGGVNVIFNDGKQFSVSLDALLRK